MEVLDEIDVEFKEGFNLGYSMQKLDDKFAETFLQMHKANEKSKNSRHDKGVVSGIWQSRVEIMNKERDLIDPRKEITEAELDKMYQDYLREQKIKEMQDVLNKVRDKNKDNGLER